MSKAILCGVIFFASVARADDLQLSLKTSHHALVGSPVLSLLSAWCSWNGVNVATAKGEIRNISAKNLERVHTYLVLRDAQGNLVDSSEGDMLDISLLRSGERSGFSALGLAKRVPVSCEIDFLDENLAPVVWRDDR